MTSQPTLGASPGGIQKVKTLLIVVAVLLLCAMAGCGKSQHGIAGKWRTEGSDANAMIWEFSEDGSVLMGGTRGKYTFGDRDRIKIQTPFGTSVYQIDLSQDHMILKDPRGSKLEFTKAK
jgi:hypothetical protein